MGPRTRPPSKTALFEAAKAWDSAAVKAMLAAASALVQATDPKGRMACTWRAPCDRAGKGLGERTASRSHAIAGGRIGTWKAKCRWSPTRRFRATPGVVAVARGENLPLVGFPKAGAYASILMGGRWRDDAWCDVNS